MRYVNGTRLDDRIIRTDWDAGFIEGRQYGRGKHGGQVCFMQCRKEGRRKLPLNLKNENCLITSYVFCHIKKS